MAILSLNDHKAQGIGKCAGLHKGKRRGIWECMSSDGLQHAAERTATAIVVTIVFALGFGCGARSGLGLDNPDAAPQPQDAEPFFDAMVPLDHPALGTWYFEVLSGALRFVSLALCSGDQARLMSSLSGSGPNANPPISGEFFVESDGQLHVTFPTSDASVGFEDMVLQWEPDSDTLIWIGGEVSGWDVSPGVRPSDTAWYAPYLDPTFGCE